PGASMKPGLKPGLTHTRKLTVDEPRVINFMGDDCRVYATPRIISDVEYTCRDFLLGHLDAGEDSVGTKVNWEHVGPALLGGVIARLFLEHARRGEMESAEVVAIAGRSTASRGNALAREFAVPFVIGVKKLIEARPEVVIEAASHDAVREHAEALLSESIAVI